MSTSGHGFIYEVLHAVTLQHTVIFVRKYILNVHSHTYESTYDKMIQSLVLFHSLILKFQNYIRKKNHQGIHSEIWYLSTLKIKTFHA
jgi:hypothetical protein